MNVNQNLLLKLMGVTGKSVHLHSTSCETTTVGMTQGMRAEILSTNLNLRVQ